MKHLSITYILAILLASIISQSCQKNDSNPNGLSVKKITDSAYGSSPFQKMDIYLPPNSNSSTPLLILIHGGAWEAGDKSEMNVIVNQLQQQWPEAAIANINYRLSNDSIHHTEIMNDIQAAEKFLYNNRSALSISDNFFMVGASAGGQLAQLFTYKFNQDNHVKAVANYFGPSLIRDWDWYNSFNLWLSKPVKTILEKYMGSVWNDSLYASTSPYWQVQSTSKPTITFHGTLDVIVPIYQSQWMKSKLDSLNVPNEYHEYVDFHGFSPENYQLSVKKMITFFKLYL